MMRQPVATRRQSRSTLATALFGSWRSALTTLLLGTLLAIMLMRFADWAIFSAVWWSPSGDAAPCRAARGQGACWALLREKARFILFATYPYEQQWRPAVGCILLLLLIGLSTVQFLWGRGLLLIWALGLFIIGILMWGGILGLPFVHQEVWGGLPVTLLLATFGIAFAFPIGILLALARQSSALPVIKALAIGYIELIRAVPLVSLLFMASFVLPIFLPTGLTIDKVLRAQCALIVFSSVYLAEAIRGGLQSIPRGQEEAASALGLGYWQTQMLIILPQALRASIPSLVNTSISLFKSTSLVLVVGIYDLLAAGKASIVDPQWQSYGLEMFIAVSLVYFALFFPMSRYSQYVEARLSPRR
jgi:general L-amino acid transport system permease protein